jgi:hypothetical protein
MNNLNYILLTIFLLSLIFNYSYYIEDINTPEEQITLNGNTLPTKNMIKKLKRYGFKTIRFPVTWLFFIDEYGNVNSDWMLLVKKLLI